MKDKPPKPASWLLKLLSSRENKLSLIGDFEEEYKDICLEKGYVISFCWCWLQVFISVLWLVKSQIIWSFIMFKNYFKTAIRNIKRHKAYSFINISGFAISMAMFILILLFVLHELSIDKFQNNFDRIYKVSTWNKLSNRYSTDSHPPLAELLANMYPEIEKTVRLHYWSGFSQYYQYNGQGYKMENIIFSDPSIFNIFTFDVVQGDLSSASTNPLSLVLTESQAKRIFGDKNPLGKIIQRNKTTDFTITAIIKDAPSSSILQYNGFASISSLTSW